MTPYDVAKEFEDFASKVTKLPGVSRINPHAFAEAKDELAREMMRRAQELRTKPPRAGQSDAERSALIRAEGAAARRLSQPYRRVQEPA